MAIKFTPSKRELTIQLISALLIALLAYAALSKLMDYGAARRAMLVQVFERDTALVLTWLVPATELLIVCLLLYPPTRGWGLWAATLLMAAFSIYLLLAHNGSFAKVPCSCGGILGKMDYQVHLVFNLCFVALGSWGIFLSHRHTKTKIPLHPKERRPEK